MDLARWYAADTPVIPDPTMHTSASWVRWPWLPSVANGFALGESNQKDRVAFGVGRLAGPFCVMFSRTLCWTAYWSRGTESISNLRMNRSLSYLIATADHVSVDRELESALRLAVRIDPITCPAALARNATDPTVWGQSNLNATTFGQALLINAPSSVRQFCNSIPCLIYTGGSYNTYVLTS